MPSDYIERQRQKKLQLNRTTIPYIAKTVTDLGNGYAEIKPDPQYLLGLDPSHWSNVVDFQKAKENGISFAIIKAKNSVFTSQFWKENYRGAKDAGITVGAYLWLYPASVMSPGRQAREFAKLLADYPIDLPPCIDFEWTSPKNPTASDLYSCAVPLMEALGITQLINYTAVGYWSQFGSRNPWFADVFYNWQAQYRVLKPSPMLPWKDWTFWQWTDQGSGEKYGFRRDGERKCTLNYMRKEAFAEMTGG